MHDHEHNERERAAELPQQHPRQKDYNDNVRYAEQRLHNANQKQSRTGSCSR